MLVGKQHVRSALSKLQYCLIECFPAHLAMNLRQTEFRHVGRELRAHCCQVLDPWTDDEALPTAPGFAQQCRAHHDRVEIQDEAADRLPHDRRLGEKADVEKPHEG
jgi:hypothetical protein